MKHWAVAVVVMVAGLAVAATAFFASDSGAHVRVDGGSMKPLIEPGEDVTVVKVAEVHRGDVVMFNTRSWPDHHDGVSFKRVLGVGEDTVAVEQGQLKVNGRSVIEDFVNGDETMDFTVKVPPGQVFVAGDARADAADSRIYGNRGGIPTTDVTGVVVAVNGKSVRPTKAFTDAGLPGEPARASNWPVIGTALGLAVFVAGLIWLVMTSTRRRNLQEM